MKCTNYYLKQKAKNSLFVAHNFEVHVNMYFIIAVN